MKNKLIILLFTLLFLIGCKPQEIIVERVITKTDSAAIIKLQERVNYQVTIIERLETSLDKARTEITKLQSEQSSHNIKYDTNAPINPNTGQYPKESETISSSKHNYENATNELEKNKQKYVIDIASREERIADLESQINIIKDENSQLKSQTKPTSGFNFRLALMSFAIGFLIPVLFSLRHKIKKILFAV